MTCKWTLWWLMRQDYENLDLLLCINRSFALHKTLDSIACKLVFLSLVSHFIMFKFFAVVLHYKSTRWFFFISKLRIHYWKRPQILPIFIKPWNFMSTILNNFTIWSVYTKRECVQWENQRERNFWAVLRLKYNTNSKAENHGRLLRQLVFFLLWEIKYGHLRSWGW